MIVLSQLIDVDVESMLSSTLQHVLHSLLSLLVVHELNHHVLDLVHFLVLSNNLSLGIGLVLGRSVYLHWYRNLLKV